MATSGGGGGGGGGVSREGSAKATVEDQICQAVQSTSNLLHLMQNSSPSQVHLIKLPKNILAKASTVKNTGQVLDQLPKVISSLDAYMENSLQSVSHLKTVTQLLSNMESSQLRSSSQVFHCEEVNSGMLGKMLDSFAALVLLSFSCVLSYFLIHPHKSESNSDSD
ncbi:hypothetical protein J5N97_008328 [Dioscorea zingiberensis]|uniref:Tobamovirus multiplication protein 2B n=1 Tax=Dioscorea zingiberensis TaxID=325984 RepID=A0A9D5HWZ4_9LILI|nr:hypothetical protein J5N97_008328 [Dioscorea zingiberensis]